MKRILVTALTALAIAFAGQATGTEFNGKASYYANKFNGRKTASGQIFSNSKMTAAHKSLRFGTKVKVTNKKNGKSAIFVINDRGPFVKGRVIDVSSAGAAALGFKQAGVAPVKVEVLGKTKAKTKKEAPNKCKYLFC